MLTTISKKSAPCLAALCAVLVASGLACSGDDSKESDGSGESPDSATKTIGSEGGTIEAGGATLKVPAGAVDAEVDLTVEKTDEQPPDQVVARTSIYRFRPEGIEFNEPVEVRLPVEEAGDGELTALFWSVPEDQREEGGFNYRPLPTTVNEENGEIWATVDHFSGGFGATPPRCNGGRCFGGVPCVNGFCYSPDCDNDRENGFETDVDCGGADCGGCAVGKDCDVNADCKSESCGEGTCAVALTPDVTESDAGRDGGDGGDAEDVGSDGGSDADARADIEEDAGPDVDPTDNCPTPSGDWPTGTQNKAVYIESNDDNRSPDSTVDDWCNFYAAGTVEGELHGKTGDPRGDAYLVKYNAGGERVWTRLFGSNELDEAHAVATDSAGDIYVAGNTDGAFPTYANGASRDGFVAKFDPAGNQLWVHQFEFDSTSEPSSDYVHALAIGGSDEVFVAGQTDDGAPQGESSDQTPDAFLARYAPDGTREWVRFVGTGAWRRGLAVAADGVGSVYLGGWAREGPCDMICGDGDGFIAKYSVSGTRQWTTAVATNEWDHVIALAADANAVYAAGRTQGPLGGESHERYEDAFVAKYAASTGAEKWVDILGSQMIERAETIFVDDSGTIYVAGQTSGELEGKTPSQGSDAFVAAYDASGNRQGLDLRGHGGAIQVRSVFTDPSGHVYVGGHTSSSFGNTGTPGGYRAFMLRMP